MIDFSKKLFFTLFIFLALSGCSLRYGDDLLVAPRLPDEYKILQVKLDEITAGGAAFLVAADSGQARQSVQLVDLDGDGEDEAVAFFRTSEGEIRVYVFRRAPDSYIQVGMAVGYGHSLHSVSYLRLGTDGALALAVSWGQDGGGYGMTVFGVNAETELFAMLDIQYVEYTAIDLEGDTVDEIIAVRRTVKDSGDQRFYASFFSIRDGVYKEFTSADLCKEVRSVTNLAFGRTTGAVPAVYIDSQAIGGGYVSDVISLENGQAVNETMDPAGESGKITYRLISVLSMDINGDGILDVPVSDTAAAFASDSPADTTRANKLYWKNFSGGADIGIVALTYHNVADKWYIFWPESWGGNVYAEYSKTSYMQRTRFYIPVGDILEDELDASQRTLLSICVFSGDDRAEHRKMYGSYKNLKTTATHIYCYSLPADATQAKVPAPEEVEAMFRAVDSSWRSETP